MDLTLEVLKVFFFLIESAFPQLDFKLHFVLVKEQFCCGILLPSREENVVYEYEVKIELFLFH